MNSVKTNRKASSARRATRKTSIGVLVLGMHRSGTSAMTRVLNLLGCALPESVVGPSEGNELGHWEAAAAVTLNDEILATAGSSWEDWGPVNADWRQSGMRTEMLGRVKKVVQEHEALGPLFVLKDPRLCRLADLWLEGMDSVGVEARVILMLRHPNEVAASLEARDLMAPGYGQLLWLRHSLDAERFSRGRQRVVCRFERLVRDWPGVIEDVRKGLSIALPRNSPTVHAEVDAFLDRGHRHHDANEGSAASSAVAADWLKRVFEIFNRWSEAGEDPADHAELDRISAEFDRAYAAFSRLLLTADLSGTFASGSRLKQELERQAAELAQKTAQFQFDAAEIERLKVRETELADKSAALMAALENAQAQTEALHAELADQRAAIASAEARAAEAEALSTINPEVMAQIEELTAALATAQQQTAAEQGQRSAAEQQLADRTAALEALEAQQAALAEQARQLQEALVAAQQEAQDHAQRSAAAERQSAEDSAALKELQARHAERTAEAREALEEANLRNADLSGRLAATESNLVQRQEELAQLWNQITELEKASGSAQAELAGERELRRKSEAQLTAARTELQALAVANARLDAEAAAVRSLAEQQADERLRLWDQVVALNDVVNAARVELARERDQRLQQELRVAQLEAAKAQLEARPEPVAPPPPEHLFDEIAQLTGLLQQYESTMASNAAARAAAERQLEQRNEELAHLTAVLAESQNAQSIAAMPVTEDPQKEWLREMTRLADQMPKWWALLPESQRRKRAHALYRRAGLFDAEEYLLANPDVAAHGMDPVRHYILHGMAEGRPVSR